MFDFLNRGKYDEILESQRRILDVLNRPEQKPDFDETSVALMRHLLGSIDLSDVAFPKKNLKPDERKDYVAKMSTAYVALQPLLKEFIQAQKDFMANGGELYHEEEPKQIIFARGTINGLYLVIDKLEDLHKESLTAVKPKEEFDPHAPFPEIPSISIQ